MKYRSVGCLALVVIALSATALKASAGPPATARVYRILAAGVPRFVMPDHGSLRTRLNDLGGRTVQLLNPNGSLYASRVFDRKGRQLQTRFDFGHGDALERNYLYSGRRPAPAPHRRFAASDACHDVRNASADKWNERVDWWWTKRDTPYYLNLTYTETALRSAHSEWANVDDYCGVPDNSAWSSAYFGETTTEFGANYVNTVGFGPVPNSRVGIEQGVVSGNTIVESDILLSTTYLWINGHDPGRYDVQNCLAHEMGHQLGFGHVNDDSNVMYSVCYKDDTTNRKLGKGDALEDNAKY